LRAIGRSRTRSLALAARIRYTDPSTKLDENGLTRMTNKLQGIFTPHMVPLDAAGRFSVEASRAAVWRAIVMTPNPVHEP
jgi:hypothetical protein